MTMFHFGRRPPEDVTVLAAWGARAIFKVYPQVLIDLLPDRMQMDGDDSDGRQRLADWINQTGIPELHMMVGHLSTGDAAVVQLDDGPFHIEASPQQSYGYLYIGAWLRA